MDKKLKDQTITEWNNAMDNFCSCIDFGKSYLNNGAIQFMNRGFDIDKIFKAGQDAQRKKDLDEIGKLTVYKLRVKGKESQLFIIADELKKKLEDKEQNKKCNNLYDFNSKVCGVDGLCDYCKKLEEKQDVRL